MHIIYTTVYHLVLNNVLSFIFFGLHNFHLSANFIIRSFRYVLNLIPKISEQTQMKYQKTITAIHSGFKNQ